MLDISIHYLSKILGVVYRGKSNMFAKGVSIDSREVKEDDLFFALPGENFDGNEFATEALEKGAICAVVTDVEKVKDHEVQNLIITNNTTQTLQDLAKLTRQNCLIPVIAITGSVGKTTTKDILYSILSKKLNTVKTKGNFNNEIGLPMTLCYLDKESEAAVVEMGMRALGQIDFLCDLALPNMAIITNIGTTHAELLGSKENIAKAKAEVLKFIPKDGTVVLNSNDKKLLQPYIKDCKGKIYWFGSQDTADYKLEKIVYTDERKSIFELRALDENIELELGIPGEHNILNAISAVAIARSLNLEWDIIKEGLKDVEMSDMRLQIETSKCGTKIINDSYNANPDSMKAALKFLGEFKNKRKIAVLGDMYELGKDEKKEHELIGEYVQNNKIDKLIVIGELAHSIGKGAENNHMNIEDISYFKENKEALNFLEENVGENDIVLIKGSRGMQMEQIAEGLMR